VIVYWQFFSSNLHWYTNVNLLLSYVDYKWFPQFLQYFKW
jgi:hypothetical protein